jgi:YjbE family integral membrane protein
MESSVNYGLAILEVAWINILLSGDNAVVIALACRSLPERSRRWGIFLGSGAAILLRVVFAFIVTWLIAVPFLQAAGGALLLWIAVSLAGGSDEDEHDIKAHHSLWNAVGTIAMADAVMSLDNVVAIAAVARGDPWLFIIGLILSIPLIVVGASLITNMLARFPLLVWAGAALLGFIAGEMIADDQGLLSQLGRVEDWTLHYGMALLCAAFVIAAAHLLRRQARVQ